MAKGILRNSGKIITAVMLFIYSGVAVFAAELKTEMTRTRIPAGESATLKLMISGSTSDIKPLSVPAVDGIKIVMSGTSRSFQFINGKSWSGVTLNFTIYAEKKGTYRIPPFVISADGERIQSDPVNIVVTDGAGGGAVHSGEGVSARGDVSLSSTDVYAGEPVLMRYYASGASSAELQVEGVRESPVSKGFVIKQINEQKEDAENKIRVASYCLIPADTGKHEVGGGSASVIVEVEDGFFTRTVRRELRFPDKTVNVKALPSSGRPADFRGDVGEFTIETGNASGAFSVGDEIRIPVKIRGRGNLLTLSKPSVEKQDGVKILTEEKEPVLSADEKNISGEKEYTVTIIPEREGECSIGRVTLSYFNPYKKIYERIESAPVTFTVKGAAQKKVKDDAPASISGRGVGFYILLAVAAAIAAGGAVFLFMQSRQFRAVSADVKEDAAEKADPVNSDRDMDFLSNIEMAYNNRDAANFLLYAERLTGAVEEGKLADADASVLRSIRDEIHLCRYGGGTIDPARMEFIYFWLKKNVR